jgi:uncharacterized ion transporter superfamily protein YfcC
MAMKNNEPTLKLPHTLVLIYSLLVLAWLATLLVPSGEFLQKEVTLDGVRRLVTVPGSYQSKEKVFLNPAILLEAPVQGFVDGALIIVFLFVIGGSFGVIAATEAIDRAIRRLALFFSTRPRIRILMIPVLMVIFSLAGALFGMSEEVIPFVLVFIPLAISLGYDSIVGVAIPFLGAAAGFGAAFFNPFTVGVAQGLAGLPLYSGLGYRLVAWVVTTTVMIVFVMLYARRVRANPSSSPVYDIDQQRGKGVCPSGDDRERLSWRHRLVLVIFLSGIGVLVAGVLLYQWYIKPIAAVFLAMGLLGGLAGGRSGSEIARSFVDGAKDMVNVALIIACGRALLIIAQEGKILDTLLYHASGVIALLPRWAVAQSMLVIQSVINFFIHSGTAQAALTMPVMAPLSDLVGVSRQTTVFAFQLCELINPILPTSAVTMGVLGMAKIPWERWARWFLPLMLGLLVMGFLLLVPPVLMNWGPF